MKNADIIRIQGFSQSLMHQILKMNKHLSTLQEQINSFEGVTKKLPHRGPVIGRATGGVAVTPTSTKRFAELRDLFLALARQFEEKAGLISLLENRHVALAFKRLITTTERSALSQDTFEALQKDVNAVLAECSTLLDRYQDSNRLSAATSEFKDKVTGLSQELAQLANSEQTEEGPLTASIAQRSKLLQKYAQLVYQTVFEHVRTTWEQQVDDKQSKEQVRKESFDRSTLLTNSADGKAKPAAIEKQEQSIAEQETFTEGLTSAFQSKDLLAKIASQASALFSLSDLPAD